MGKRHEGMKTALGGGSQHREKDVNDSRGKRINNARLPLSLHPNVPLSPPSPLSVPSSSPPFVYFSFVLSIYCIHSQFCPLCIQVTDLTSRGSSPHQASAAAVSPPPLLSVSLSVCINCEPFYSNCCLMK